MNYHGLAERALAGGRPAREEGRAVLASPDEDLLALLDAAFRVRRRHFGKAVQIHYLINAKSGLCPEDCAYCSQSAVSDAEIPRYGLVDDEALIEGAARAAEAGSLRYCIVISGRGPTDAEIGRLCSVVGRIKERHGLSICCSLGLLDGTKARRLKEAGVDRLNHNLNTSQRFYGHICSTHTYGDRLETLSAGRSAGLELCSGVIFGQGEGEEDVLDVCEALRSLGPESIPVNFLHPIPGTPLERLAHLGPRRCLRLLCLMRFYNPAAEIRVAGGREVQLRDLQPLALYPANSIFVEGYLTTPGQGAAAARRMIEDMGFEVEERSEARAPAPETRAGAAQSL
ncbi:MAG: biotin synthase BioB [Candidatus Tectomicrobia bacterium]|uniref:Biotin synthase n=1 Tax=Tectimicrobiota bacterium TaxID=2528274 RepID=A0A932I151_UNCTE|nr:biotin synthase BioB [Candidatus Tectomicrobia bacterium]